MKYLLLTLLIILSTNTASATFFLSQSSGETLTDAVITHTDPFARFYLYYEVVSGDWCSYDDVITNGVTTMADILNNGNFSGSGNCAGVDETTPGVWVIGHYDGFIIDETANFTVNEPISYFPVGTTFTKENTQNSILNTLIDWGASVFAILAAVLGVAVAYLVFRFGWRRITQTLNDNDGLRADRDIGYKIEQASENRGKWTQ